MTGLSHLSRAVLVQIVVSIASIASIAVITIAALLVSVPWRPPTTS